MLNIAGTSWKKRKAIGISLQQIHSEQQSVRILKPHDKFISIVKSKKQNPFSFPQTNGHVLGIAKHPLLPREFSRSQGCLAPHRSCFVTYLSRMVATGKK